jgi:hypothetical protein
MTATQPGIGGIEVRSIDTAVAQAETAEFEGTATAGEPG